MPTQVAVAGSWQLGLTSANSMDFDGLRVGNGAAAGMFLKE